MYHVIQFVIMCRYLISYVHSTRDTVSHVEANRYFNIFSTSPSLPVLLPALPLFGDLP